MPTYPHAKRKIEPSFRTRFLRFRWICCIKSLPRWSRAGSNKNSVSESLTSKSRSSILLPLSTFHHLYLTTLICMQHVDAYAYEVSLLNVCRSINDDLVQLKFWFRLLWAGLVVSFLYRTSITYALIYMVYFDSKFRTDSRNRLAATSIRRLSRALSNTN